MKTEEFCMKVNEHVFNNLLPQISNSVTRFAAAAAVGTGVVGRKAAEAAGSLGCLDGDEVDLGLVKAALARGFESVPDVCLYGMHFHVDDADALMASLSR